MACAHTGRTGRQSAHPAGLARLRTRPWPMDRPCPPTPASGSTSARRRRWRWVGPSATTGVRAALVDARLVRSVSWRVVIIRPWSIRYLEQKRRTTRAAAPNALRRRLPCQVGPIECDPLAAAIGIALARHVDQDELRAAQPVGIERGVHDERRAGKPREPDPDRVEGREQGVGRVQWDGRSSLPSRGGGV